MDGPEVAEFPQRVLLGVETTIEEAAQHLAERFDYHYGTLTDGTIILEPPEDNDG